MRVTFVLPHAGLSGGIRVVAIYAKAMKERGHDVFVLSTPRPEPTSLKSRVKKKLTEAISGPPPREPGHLDNVDVKHVVLDRFRPLKDADVPDADVIVATWWETAEWVNALSPSKGAKVYFIQHDERFVNVPAQRVEATWRLPFYKITIAQWLVDLGRHYYNQDVALVPNGVDVKHFTAPPRTKRKTPAVGMMYAPSPFKGCDITLQAFQMAARNIAGLEMVAFGQHEVSEGLLPTESTYHFRPAQSKIPEIYAAADAWLFGSRSEGFGLPILESMACRTPVIGTPTGAAPELIRHGGGVLVKPQDPIDMARAIERVCRMTLDQWKQMSDIAYQTAQQNTWDRSCELFEAALFKACGR